jgi:anti-sigma factor ChrR (cupin superfamily)
MELHADLSQRALFDSNALDWTPSPMAGVERRMLDRHGEEVARATSLVRYAPGSRFERHSHGGGEEILVLEGTFSDEQGDYPAGTYLRNPVGSNHAPSCEPGCTILVKLQQMHPADQQRLVIDTTNSTWVPGLVRGLEVLPLHAFGSGARGPGALGAWHCVSAPRPSRRRGDLCARWRLPGRARHLPGRQLAAQSTRQRAPALE